MEDAVCLHVLMFRFWLIRGYVFKFTLRRQNELKTLVMIATMSVPM
jgi:hypothetical protein